MFVALWEYEVKPGGEERFEKAYGPEGDWVRLFRSDSRYHETRLVRDSFRRGVYLTMDFWQSREAYEMVQRNSQWRATSFFGWCLPLRVCCNAEPGAL
jgi:hypothetical protein